MDEQDAVQRFFGLRSQPFAPTADPAYFYASRAHKECLFRLWSAIDARHGLALVLGNYGAGKTTLLRKLLTGMRADPERYGAAVIASPVPSWTSFALLERITAQFGLRPAQASFAAHMEALNQCLLARREQITTLIIDDAQNLNKRGQLELLRLVQNLETPRHKLLNLVLFAQLEWVTVLRAAPNFEQRISMATTLEPLSFGELEAFIAHRLQQAGAAPGTGPEFTPPALRAIHAYAEGNPRLTVHLCRNTLQAAAQVQSRRIGHELVLHTIEKTTVPDPERRARVAAAIMDMLRQRGEESRGARTVSSAPPPPSAPPRSEDLTREQRATRLLLRARGRQEQD